MGITFAPLLVVVLEIQAIDLVFYGIDVKGKTQVPSNAQAPCSSAIARNCVRVPHRQRPQFLGMLHVIEKGQHLTKLIHAGGRNAFCIVFCIEMLQTLMGNAPYFHLELT